ncbi:protein zerknuellt 1-like [Papilio machaon]|uniref:protein zerknuellt 1-like n=1 Tax=Papilio machaon TaxID=76193 RepID=UPI001E665C57|nr:protein zerknuellt 1-like [Papilio machaon]
MYLENEFLKSHYIGVVSRKEIANKLNIPERAVKVWFQNRRMKEKKDITNRPVTEYHHYVKTGHNVRSVNDQLSNVETLQLNNNLCSHSISPQPKSKASLNDSTIDHFQKKNHNNVSNTTNNMETERKPTDDVIMSHNFQNKTITSSSNEVKRNAELSIELLKKYKNHMHNNSIKKTVKSKKIQSKHSEAKKPKLNSQTMERKSHGSVPLTAPSIVKHQQAISQIPSGYIPLYPQQHSQQYHSPGNLIWKPLGPAGMSNLMSMGDFAFLPNPHTVSNRLPKSNNIQKSQCSCNCHMNPRLDMTAFSHENPPQYVIAVPFHKPPVQFRSPL